ncbi:glycoside hydrolase family 66 protein [Clostridium beijerinckii]|uniref:glycoside hydrolase family 66 protein n=1 Tax=Clostridium beijerinckii TaxID=1520 RepID=UPI00098BF6DA|nr:glycoside hydrolase family 66 protein [Clostridium beijerinckii]MDG5852773.1 glycoside hydrolase family 66 protein [Clostridium beijerinckii]NRT78910.1 dextranase [Clostridium beijerinckii]OOM49758.1 cycloisomaltooligosaccharide glucanotransferase precursor [Clostridium beijerinckii]
MKNSRKKLKILCSLALMSTTIISTLSLMSNTAYAKSDFIEMPIVNTSEKGAFNQKLLLYDVSTDKSMYNPGSNVSVKINLVNYTGNEISNGTIELSVKHLDTQVGNIVTQNFSIEKDENKELFINWTAPNEDFKGYLLEITCKDSEGKVIESSSTAVDVSSNWLKFPRYGYLSNYEKSVNTKDIIDQLKKFHINGLQYYDWQDKHHDPIAGEGSNVEDVWQDLSKHDVYKSTIEGYIKNGHEAGISSMQYNLIYGATQGYENDGVKKEWGLYKDPSGTDGEQWTMAMPSGWETDALYFMDPSNKEWQDYLFAREKEVFEAFDFDGWHMDTVGDFGTVYKADGTPVSITNTFKDFINAAKKEFPDKYILFNPVGNKGHEDVNSSNVSGAYTEVWPWDGIITYNSLKGIVDQARTETKGRSLIVPAYMNYDLGDKHSEEKPGKFNTSSVLLTGASVFAAGGSRLELGDDTRMLTKEYFPNRNVVMDEELKARERKYYDFIVAYENLLRDGQINSNNQIQVEGYENSNIGEANKIWTYGKKDSNYDVIQMVNLLGVFDNTWRAADGSKSKPIKAENFKVKYYVTQDIQSVLLASPDANDCKSQSLEFSKGNDEKGNYIEFTVPSLEYWDMIYLKKLSSENIDKNNDIIGVQGQLTNPGFEDGFMGWNISGRSYGLDSTDAASGNNKLYFYDNKPYTKKIDQTVVGLKNGKYTVTAMVKQNTGIPDYAAMELTSGDKTEKVNIKHGDNYRKIEGTIDVKDGKLNVAFNFISTLNGEANLQIDDIQLLDENGNVVSKEAKVIKQGEGASSSNIPESVGKITNGDFETGDTTGWVAANPDGFGVNDEDAFAGNDKCYFWGQGKQMLQQKVTELPNGTYTVKAMVKQNTGNPTSSQLELSGFGGEAASVKIPHGDSYVEISQQVTVTNGTLIISFIQDGKEWTNLQIDNVELIAN